MTRQPTVMTWTNESSRGVIAFDAVLLEAPTHAVNVTEYPIELGAPLIDHIRPQPVTLRITAFVSNAPAREGLTHMDSLRPGHQYALRVREPLVNAPPSANLPTSVAGVQLVREKTFIADVRTWSGATSSTQGLSERVLRVESIYQELKQAMYEAREFSVTSDLLGSFDRMLLKAVTTERKPDSGNSLRIDLELQQVSYATLTKRDVSALLPKPKPAARRSEKPVDTGKQAPKPADEQTDSKLRGRTGVQKSFRFVTTGKYQ